MRHLSSFFFLSNKIRSFDSISKPCKYFDYPDYEVCQEVASLRASVLPSVRSSRDATEVATTATLQLVPLYLCPIL